MKWNQVARMGMAWLRGSVKLRYAPKQISIEPTNICNYRCSFCPQSKAEHRALPSGYMQLDDLDVILDKVVAAGAAWSGTISFTHDGEPLLHPEFPEFVRRANLRGLRPRFSSNGSRLTPEKADLMEEAGYFRPSIDFSGSKEIFEKHRGKTGHWEQIRDNLAYLIAMTDRNPKVSLEVTEMGGFVSPKNNQELLERLKASLPTPKSDRVKFGVRVFHNAAGTAPRELVQIDGIPETNGKHSSAPNASESNGNGAHNKPRYRKCPYPWTSMVIAWNGEVHACCRDLEGRTRLGNAVTCNSLWDIWNGEAYREFRHLIANRQPEKLAACVGCDLPWDGDPRKWSWSNIYRALQER